MEDDDATEPKVLWDGDDDATEPKVPAEPAKEVQEAGPSTSPTDEERVNRLMAWADEYVNALHQGKIKPCTSHRKSRAKPYCASRRPAHVF